ncbi:hypothetical protein [Lysobacter panacisoli]|uniref:Uncharacterized protein n=1 Tax=Lysobacter panacisoli TaxID=1255263 RepID=A0ABP9LQU5_9GAMM|nr:hypothetical protein [Lysobacter panacisoli]
MQLFKNEVVRDNPFPNHDLSFDTPLFPPRYARRERTSALSTSTLLGSDEFDRDYLGQMPDVYRIER